MQAKELIQELGYSESKGNWITVNGNPEKIPSLTLRHALLRTKDEGVIGAYIFHTSSEEPTCPKLPPQAAVYVAKAKDNESAQELHKSIWNLGIAPFLIVILPNEVRVYKGFRYEPTDNVERADIIQSIDNPTLELVRKLLKDFYAQEIDSGRIWQTQAENLSLETRVDRQLLENLNKLGDLLVKNENLPPDLAHELIGKYIYIRYLRDRKILSDEWLQKKNLNLKRVLGRDATCESLLELAQALEIRFNGNIFPISSPEKLSDKVVSRVASIFKGDKPDGQLALDFKVYDFSYIPIETLSSIYEQFLRREEKQKEAGAYYTPVPLADYLISEINYEMPLDRAMKVLDPCCGSGVFLVLAYQRLIELEIRHKNRELTAVELSKILQQNIYGVEKHKDACFVTEFSLILALLSHIEPPDLHRNEDFKFPALHNKNIFESDFFDNKSLFWKRKLRFNWIIGNPPWLQLRDNKDEMVEDPPALVWIHKAISEGRIVDMNRVSDAFCWRASELLAGGGYVGLVLPAASLTNKQCHGFRTSFFKKMEVRKITNFSNLVYKLFAGRADAPAITVVFKEYDGESVKPEIIHYGPFAINQVPTRTIRSNKEGIWAITICEDEISVISPEEAESGESLIWKMALWGSYRDKRAIQRLQRIFPTTIGELCRKREWNLEKGLQLRGSDTNEKIEPLPGLARVPQLNTKLMNKSNFRFSVPSNILEKIPKEQQYVRVISGKAGMDVVNAPHLFITNKFAAYSDLDFALPHGKIGLAAPKSDADQLRAISLILNSSVFRYLLFFHSSSWGTDRSIVKKYEIANLPFPKLNDLHVSKLAQLHLQLAEEEMSGSQGILRETGSVSDISEQLKDHLQEKCDKAIEDILDIPKGIRLLVRDFWNVRYLLNKGKAVGKPDREPSNNELRKYATCLIAELDIFANTRHKVQIRKDRDLIACTVEITNSKMPFKPEIIEPSTSCTNSDRALLELLKRQYSQWVYVKRGLRVFEGPRVHMFKSPRLIDWTQTQALLDADDVIGEVLAHRGSES